MKIFLASIILLSLLFPVNSIKAQDTVRISFDEENFVEYAVFDKITDKEKDESYLNYYLKQRKEGKDPFAVLYSVSPRLSGDIQIFACKTKVNAENARILFDKNEFNNPFSFSSEKDGRELDADKTVENIFSGLDKGGKFVIKPVYNPISPTVTIKQAEEKVKKLSTFSTTYKTSSLNRCKNLELAAERINGVVLKPGEIFSFNQATKQRTEENGYFPATVIVNGEYVEGMGGGVCQVSTTLFNAVKKARLSVTERYVHTLPPSYVEQGADATVSESMDFKFKNDTDEPLYIIALTRDKTLTVTLYGKEIKK